MARTDTLISPRPDAESVSGGFVRRRLVAAPAWMFNIYAAAAAFACYFSMYAFRRPYTVAEFEGQTFLGSDVTFKTALITSQVLGYCLAKYIGIKTVSESKRAGRGLTLIGLIAVAELALLLFAVLPGPWKLLAMFLNGIPLGMIWGLVVRYLEGRRSSDFLLACLACSFVVAGGAVKDLGKLFLDASFTESWMPFLVGLLFLPPFLLSVWLLEQVPEPDAEEMRKRAPRVPMDGAARRQFLRRLLVPLLLFFTAYVAAAAFRDFRDNFGIEILNRLGYGHQKAVFTSTEMPIAFAVLAAMAGLTFIAGERRGLMVLLSMMAGGTALVGIATLAFERQLIDGLWWYGLTGLGAYLAYVPFNAIVFDRVIAISREPATAVFAIYIADALAYTGSISFQLYRDFYAADLSRAEFLGGSAYLLAIIGTLSIATGGGLLLRQSRDRPISAITESAITEA